ncbi:MAG: hypothetical protein H6830_07290 [Planctomycetes bacterium]|nr:hypothetical protein [Planctomycetota bacterium]MCB9910203.1 hypothetical protein [Planctomycetota bacterium]HPF14853.1 hypothetical protein [Planctomycetota bacterium]
MSQRSTWKLVLGACLLTGSAWAQDSIPADQLQGLAGSDRELMHPGNPLLVVGLDQADNQFRASTPALTKAEVAATQVDPAELRARRLAMYQEGSRFDRPLVASSRLTTTDPLRELPEFAADRKRVETPAEAPKAPSWNPAFLVVGLIVGGYFLMARRRLKNEMIVSRGR